MTTRYTLTLTFEGVYESEEDALEDFGQSAAEMVGAQWHTVQAEPVAEGRYTTRRHPRSGETYAVELDDDGTIIRAAGPLSQGDPTDEESLYGWLANHADTADEAGEWLEAELDASR